MYRFILTTIHTFFEGETKYYLRKDQQLQKVIYRLKYLRRLQNSTPPTTKVKKLDHLLFDIFIMNEPINRVRLIMCKCCLIVRKVAEKLFSSSNIQDTLFVRKVFIMLSFFYSTLFFILL